MSCIKQKILEATQYQGNTNPRVDEISASELGSDITQIFLRQKYGVIKDTNFGQNSLGSIIHLGIDKALELDEDIVTEYKCDPIEISGLKLTGSIDIIDWLNKTIYDIKSTKEYTVKQYKKDLENHYYTWQVNAYRYLMEHKYDKKYDMKLIFILKDGGLNSRTGVEVPTIQIVDVPYIEDYKLEDKVTSIKKELDLLHSGVMELQPCKDTYIRKVKGQIVHMKCKYYCSYADKCQVNQEKLIYRKEPVF